MVGSDAAWQQRRRRFHELISAELYDRLWRQAAWLTTTREDAEDLLQDTLAGAFQHLHQLRDDSQVVPWLKSIMRRRFLNLVRHRRRRRDREAELRQALQRVEIESQHLDAASGPAEERARDALGQLQPDARWLLTMHYIEDVGTQELAGVLRLSEVAVRQRLTRARRALKVALERLQVVD